MIGLIVTLAIIGASMVGGLALIVVGLYSTGKLAGSNSPQREVQRAKVRAEVAKFDQARAEAEYAAAEARRLAAQNDIQRQLLEAKSLEDLAKIHDQKFQRELEKPLEEPRVVKGEVV